MTEAEWLACGKPDEMLRHLQRRPDRGALKRKVRLFACACFRLASTPVKGVTARTAVEVAERFADGDATREELNAAREALRVHSWLGVHPQPSLEHWAVSRNGLLWEAAQQATATAVTFLMQRELGPGFDPRSRPKLEWVHCQDEKRPVLCDLIRDLFACVITPSCRITSDIARWNEGTVIKIAQEIYGSREFTTLPILADALTDAGCADEVLLSHLRSPGPHARGCWALDLVLGKS
jgi:hypothetical protein